MTPLLKVPPAPRRNRTGAVPLAKRGEPAGADKGTTVRHGISAAGAVFPSASVNRQARRVALTPFVPLSREAGEGERAAPLAHCVGEGLGVRAKKRVRPAHSELKRCTLIRGDKGGEGNKARLPVHACTGENSPRCRDSVPNRCTLVRFVSLSRGAGEGERAAPLAHFVGEEPGLRATKLLNPREIAPNSPRIAPSPLDIRAKMCYTMHVIGATSEEPP